jgi:3-methylcrotonyl-CoA carboxylase alpha subunit
MEAMKMEHTIAAPADGTVAELLFAPGDQVAEGAELLRLVRPE